MYNWTLSSEPVRYIKGSNLEQLILVGEFEALNPDFDFWGMIAKAGFRRREDFIVFTPEEFAASLPKLEELVGVKLLNVRGPMPTKPLTVGALREALKDVPDTAEVRIYVNQGFEGFVEDKALEVKPCDWQLFTEEVLAVQIRGFDTHRGAAWMRMWEAARAGKATEGE